MNFASTSRVKRNQNYLRSSLAGVAALSLIGLCTAAHAADKPPLAPDTVAPFSTDSRLSAGSSSACRRSPPISSGISRSGSPVSTNASNACIAGCCSGRSMPIAMFGVMSNGPGESRCMAAAIASTARCGSMACLKGRAPTASRRASMARPRPAPPLKPRRVRSSAGTGRSTSISATVSAGASRRSCT